MSETELQATHAKDPYAEGRKLFQRGIVVYYLLAVLGILYGLVLFRSPFGVAGGLALAACFIIAPFQLRKGSEGWKTFTALFGLFLAMGSFAGGCAIAENTTRNLGFASLVVFLMACYLVKVFGYNQKVVAYMSFLRTSGQTHCSTGTPKGKQD